MIVLSQVVILCPLVVRFLFPPSPFLLYPSAGVDFFFSRKYEVKLRSFLYKQISVNDLESSYIYTFLFDEYE